MKRTIYKGYIIDQDDLGRTYIHNVTSPYSEDGDKKLVSDFYDKSPKHMTNLQAAKRAIDEIGGLENEKHNDYTRKR